MSKLRIADDMTLPFELAGRRTAIFGISGSGKSNTKHGRRVPLAAPSTDEGLFAGIV